MYIRMYVYNTKKYKAKLLALNPIPHALYKSPLLYSGISYVVGENIGKFGKLIAIHQYLPTNTFSYHLNVLTILSPNLPNISPPILGGKPICQYFPPLRNCAIRYSAQHNQ